MGTTRYNSKVEKRERRKTGSLDGRSRGLFEWFSVGKKRDVR